MWGYLKITIYVDVAQYPHIKLEQSLALRFIKTVMEKHGITRDLEESMRVVKNFDEYYNIAQRKSGGYLLIIRDPADSIRGKIVIHRIKLMIEGGKKIVEYIIDRRVPMEFLISSLKELGFSEVEVSYM